MGRSALVSSAVDVEAEAGVLCGATGSSPAAIVAAEVLRKSRLEYVPGHRRRPVMMISPNPSNLLSSPTVYLDFELNTSNRFLPLHRMMIMEHRLALRLPSYLLDTHSTINRSQRCWKMRTNACCGPSSCRFLSAINMGSLIRRGISSMVRCTRSPAATGPAT